MDGSRKRGERLKKVRKITATEKKKIKNLSAAKKARELELKEQKESGRFLLPDAPERKQRKQSPTRTPCPLMPGTPAVPPPRKSREWEVKAGQSTSTVVAQVTPTSTTTGKRKATPTEILFSNSDKTSYVQTAVDEASVNMIENADFIMVDAEIDLIGFAPTPSPDPAHSAVVSSPVASTSSVTNAPSPDPAHSAVVSSPVASPSTVTNEPETIFEAFEDEIAEDPGSDVEADLPDTDPGTEFSIPRQRYAAEYPAELDDLAPDLLDQINDLDARDDSALREYVSSEDMLHFNWQSNPSCFTGEREAFTGLSGPTFETDGMTPLDIFERIWDETIINLIVAETNRHANHLLAANPVLPQQSRMKHWNDITSADLWTFFGILMLQSFIPNPVEKDYWYPRFPYLRIGVFKDIMPYAKFLLIKRFIRFADNSTVPANSKLAKISPVIDHLNCKFSSLYLPEQNIAIDESLLLWKGKLSFAQLIANKAARVGIKSYELCESRTGYLWKFEVYAGKGHPEQSAEGHDVERGSYEPEGATSQIVYRLVRPLLNKGHTLVMDNFYNSPLLSRTLKAQKTDTIGTLRLNRKYVPQSLRVHTKANMRPGEIAFSHTEDLTVLVWRDYNLVSLISTYHKVEVGGAEKNGIFRYKPKVVLDYNLSMGGVDKKDQLLQAYPVERIRNMVWYKKLFRRLLNVSVHNTYVIYSHKKKIPHREFRMMLANQILSKHGPPQLTPPPPKVSGTGHFPVKVGGKPRCRQCAKSKIDSRTLWACDTCGVRLCVSCFRNYHMSLEGAKLK